MTDSTAALAVVLAIALVLSGCSALGGDATREPLSAPEYTETLRPGVANGSEHVFDPDRDHAPKPAVIVDGHEASLADAGYAVRMTHVERRTGDVHYRENWTIRVEANHTRYRTAVRVTGARGDQRVRTFANGTHVWRRLATGNETGVELLTDPNGEPRSPASVEPDLVPSRLEFGLRATTTRSVERVPDVPAPYDATVDASTTVYRVEADGREGGDGNLTLSLYVTEPGRVLGYEVRASYETENGTAATERTTVAYVRTGDVPVERPDWVPNATGANRTASAVPE